MGLFIKSKPTEPLRLAFEEALNINPQKISNLQQLANQKAEEVSVSWEFNWVRLGIAFLVLIFIAVAGIYTSVQDLQDWSKMFLHSFEIILGLLVGLLGGEAIANNQ